MDRERGPTLLKRAGHAAIMQAGLVWIGPVPYTESACFQAGRQPEGGEGLPIYEFVCRQCRGLTELFVKNAKEKIEIRCPDCGSSELRRVVSRVHSVVAEGGGPGADSAAASPLQQRSCPSGSCSTITLPGHSRSS